MRQADIVAYSTPAKKQKSVSLVKFRALEQKVDDLIKSLAEKKEVKKVVKKK